MTPIRPAAHYMMGGIRTDLHGQTNIPGLYAAGEAACTGVHGANRLASNSLLEGLVFGARAADAMREAAAREASEQGDSSRWLAATETGNGTNVENFIRQIQEMMWSKVGIVRSRQGMEDAVKQLDSMGESLPAAISRRNCEARNIHTAASLIARSALARQESRGAHYRVDRPEHDDARFKKHSLVKGRDVRFI